MFFKKWFKKGDTVPKPVERIVYSEDWEWQLWEVIQEPCENIVGFKITSKVIKPTGNWMIEEAYSGRTVLYIEGEYEGETKYYNEVFLKIVPQARKYYNIRKHL